ncbi:hypothetical protein KEM48_008271 [Puccinia striiformis f. sp. tritici PST-130]|nr:hypothetical protein KEM48_008271 [Puccinia striiformis f. sp. tritici PST-130]
MLDCEGPIVKALQNLVTQYDEIYFTWDEELYDEDRDDWTSSRWAALLDNVMKAPKDRLLQMQKCILPSLQQQRADLLESLNIADPPRDPGPRYLDALTAEISSLLSRHHVRFIVAKQSMDGLTLGCDLINLRSKVSRATAESSKAIDNVISWSRRSDFSVSQDDWQEHADILNWKLHKTLSRRQELINQLETERDANDEEGSDLEISTGTTDVSQDQHDGQPVTGPSNRYEDIRSHPSSSGDHEDGQLATSSSVGSSEDTDVRQRLIDLIESSMPLIKLYRILLNKLVNTPTGQSPFTFSPMISSAEIDEIDSTSEELDCSVQNFLNTFSHYCICDNNIPYRHHRMLADLPNGVMFREGLYDGIGSLIKLLCAHLVPSTPHVDIPPSETNLKTWFIMLEKQSWLADCRYRRALTNLGKSDWKGKTNL